MTTEFGTHNQSEIGVLTEAMIKIEQERLGVKSLALAHDYGGLQSLGYPSGMGEAMSVWAQESPDIIGTYTHSGKPKSFYPISASIKMAGLLASLDVQGVCLKPKVISYDTVPIFPLAKFPLRIGFDGSPKEDPKQNGEIIGVNEDIFGISNLNSGDFVDIEFLKKKAERFPKKIQQYVGGLLSNIGIYKDKEKKQMASVLKERLENFGTIFSEVVNDLTNSVTVDEFLSGIHWKVMNTIFGTQNYKNPEDGLGIETSIYSKDQIYLKTVRLTLSKLFESYGSSFLRSLVRPGEGQILSRVCITDKKPAYLTVGTTGQFQIINRGQILAEFSDDEAVSVAVDGIPYSKLENLALYGTGMTYHFGSEYGEREALLSLMGYKGRALELCSKMQVGADKSHGASVVNDLSSFMGYVLLGSEKIKEVCINHAKGIKIPDISTATEFKNFVKESNGIQFA